jgi:hypothetical protein
MQPAAICCLTLLLLLLLLRLYCLQRPLNKRAATDQLPSDAQALPLPSNCVCDCNCHSIEGQPARQAVALASQQHHCRIKALAEPWQQLVLQFAMPRRCRRLRPKPRPTARYSHVSASQCRQLAGQVDVLREGAILPQPTFNERVQQSGVCNVCQRNEFLPKLKAQRRREAGDWSPLHVQAGCRAQEAFSSCHTIEVNAEVNLNCCFNATAAAWAASLSPPPGRRWCRRWRCPIESGTWLQYHCLNTLLAWWRGQVDARAT